MESQQEEARRGHNKTNPRLELETGTPNYPKKEGDLATREKGQKEEDPDWGATKIRCIGGPSPGRG